LEYGVRNFGVQHIIVLGYAHCGGICTLVETGGANNPDSIIDDWMYLVEDARTEVGRSMPSAPLHERLCGSTLQTKPRFIFFNLSHNFRYYRFRIDSRTENGVAVRTKKCNTLPTYTSTIVHWQGFNFCVLYGFPAFWASTFVHYFVLLAVIL
jgi:hypothetical protein